MCEKSAGSRLAPPPQPEPKMPSALGRTTLRQRARGPISACWVLTVTPTVYTLADTVAMSFSEDLKRLNTARWRVAGGLTIAMMVLYFGFIGLVAFNKPLLATLLIPGLSLGMLIGMFVIVWAWVLIWIYVRWANRDYDAGVAALRGSL